MRYYVLTGISLFSEDAELGLGVPREIFPSLGSVFPGWMQAGRLRFRGVGYSPSVTV